MVRRVFLASWFLTATTSPAVDGPLSPQQSLAHFKTEPGLKVELVAAEPMVVDPVAVAWGNPVFRLSRSRATWSADTAGPDAIAPDPPATAKGRTPVARGCGPQLPY